MTNHRRWHKIPKFLKFQNNYKEKISGEKNYKWKGDKVSYRGLHGWINRHKTKPQLCELCNKTNKLEVANISGLYKRAFTDWKWICRKCHMIEDGRLARFIKYPHKRGNSY